MAQFAALFLRANPAPLPRWDGLRACNCCCSKLLVKELPRAGLIKAAAAAWLQGRSGGDNKQWQLGTHPRYLGASQGTEDVKTTLLPTELLSQGSLSCAGVSPVPHPQPGALPVSITPRAPPGHSRLHTGGVWSQTRPRIFLKRNEKKIKIKSSHSKSAALRDLEPSHFSPLH